MVHFWAFKNQIKPHALNALFVQLGITQIKFDHAVFLTMRQFKNQLFGIGAMFNIQTGEDLDRLFNLHNRVHTDDMAALQSVTCVLRGVDHDRQETTIEPEHIHAKPKWGQIGLAGITDLAQGQL